jgi:hypothetical protein
MKKFFERRNGRGNISWLVEQDDDGSVRAVGPNGIALHADDAGVWIDHEVPSAEFEDAYVLERVAMPTDWFVKALRANGFKVTPPKQTDFGGKSVKAARVPVKKTQFQLIKDAGDYLMKRQGK